MVGEPRLLWQRCVASVAVYCQRFGFDHIVQREPVLKIVPRDSQRSPTALKDGILPIFEKFQSFALLHEFDEILVLDADVWIRPTAPNIFHAVAPVWDFGACVERQMPISPLYARKLDRYALGQYGDKNAPFANMGVRIIRRSLLPHLKGQTPTEFIHRPEFAKYVNGEGAYRWQTEQTFLNDWLRECGANVFALDWKWNGLFGMLQPGRIDEAHFVHFLLSDHLNGDDPETLLRTAGARPRI